jgi:hypothetical protein
MITLEILGTPDPLVTGTFRFHQNQLTLGQRNCTLNVDDPQMPPGYLLIEVAEGSLVVHPPKDHPTYLLNGKRATSVRKLKPKDEITLGQTSLRILEFAQTETQGRKEILGQKLEELIRENSPRLAVIEALGRLSK